MSVLYKAASITLVVEKLKQAKESGEIAIEALDPATRDKAALDAATKIAEAVGLGIPVWFIDQAIGKTGLDRVFDSLRKNKTFEKYLKDQAAAKNLRDFGAGTILEWGLDKFRDWISVNQYLDPFFDRITSLSLGTTPDPLVKTQHFIDPLIFDLNGDGIEITPLSKGVLFDSNGDAVKTGTAWVDADDGMLVWDRNANGTIDSGRELFGDETLLANGRKATDGFAALRELDQGSLVGGAMVGAGDGVFDANDARYAELRIWRDLNQDGISQAGELKTLAQTGVSSISLQSTTVNTNLGDAFLTHSGTFARANGSMGEAGSVILAQNNFVREFTPIAVSEAAKALPGFKGSGWVRDLQEAATLSPELIALVDQAKAAPTRAAYKDCVAKLLREWGNDSAHVSASKEALDAGYGLILSNPADEQEAGWMDMAIKAKESDRNVYRATLSATDLTKFDAMRERMTGDLERVYAYEAFTGYPFLLWWRILADATHYEPRFVDTGRMPIEVTVPLTRIFYENRNGYMASREGYIVVSIPTPPTGMPHVQTLWNRLVDDASTNLMPTLRLANYFDSIDLNIDTGGVSFDFRRMDAKVAAVGTQNAQEGAAILLDLYYSSDQLLDQMGWNGHDQVRALAESAASVPEVRAAFSAINVRTFYASTAYGSETNDVYAGDASSNAFNAGTGSDLLEGMGSMPFRVERASS